MKYLPGHYLLYPCLSNNSSTNIFGLQCRPHNFQNLWVDWEDASPEVSFRVITLPKLVVSPSMFAPGLCDHWGYLIRMGRIWTSGAANTSRHGHKCRNPLVPWPRFSWLSDKIRGPMRPRWDHPWLLSLAFSLRRSGAWAIYFSTTSIWRKWIEPKLLNVDGFWKDLHLWSYWITI